MRKLTFLIAVTALIASAATLVPGQPASAGNKRFTILGDGQSVRSVPLPGEDIDSDPPEISTAAATVSLSTAPHTSSDRFSVISSTEISTAYSLNIPTSTAAGRAGDDFNRFIAEKPFFSFTRERWNKVRNDIEAGRKPEEAPAPSQQVVTSSITKPAPLPLPPGLAVELPYESQLSISGRKLIGISMKSTMYDKPEAGVRSNSSSFDMTQELQVRIKGRVGRKINVNVDFDDTRDDKRDISVVYKGDPDEIVQEAAFGDITMTLPSTEFLGYSRQLFGIKMDTRYKGLHTQGFFSRTKGFSEVKRFTGNTRFQRVTIPDTSYITQKYYSLIRPADPTIDQIVLGSVKVYQDDMRNDNNVLTKSFPDLGSIADPDTLVQKSGGNYNQLVPGQDYTVDYHTGIITFRNKLGNNFLIAVDYQRVSDKKFVSEIGKAGPKIIKDIDNIRGITLEQKNYYSLGNVKVIRDNGRGNFILNIQDLNGSTPAILNGADGETKPVPLYPNNITVDFENGVFYFNNAQALPSDLYSNGMHRYNIFTEYRYRVKIINLRPGIVPQSERVTVDGRLLKANDDYYIDYDAGIVTFFNEDRISENSVIDISYDYAPFGGSGGSTLVGVRSELSLTNSIFIGSSFIYDFAAKTQTVPDIRSAPSSLGVGEVDSRIQNVKLPILPLTMSVSGEYALSQQNPNIMGKAIVESMEGIKQEDSASLLAESWRPAANPLTLPVVRYYLSDLSWSSAEVSRTEIDPNYKSDRDEKQQILNISYNLQNASQVSMLQVLSTAGLDFSKKLYVEMWVKGDGKNEGLNVSYGAFNEDVDGSLVLRTEDTNGDGTLSPGEDIGWIYTNPNGTVSRFGAGNGRLDTEDFNSNSLLDVSDLIAGSFGPAEGRAVTDVTRNESHTSIDWTGWRLVRIPVVIKPEELDSWRNVRQLRLTISGTAGQAGSISVGRISIVGNKWESVEGAVVSAINTEDPGYVSLTTNPDYTSLYDIEDASNADKTKEQALDIKYTITASSTVESGAKLVYVGRSYDLSNYGALRFFLYPRTVSGETFFFQAGGNDTNFYEFSMPIPPSWQNSWHMITIKQVGSGGRADHWEVSGGNGTVRIAGVPSLQNINQIKVGIRSTGARTGEIWVNEIHVAEALQREGRAWKANLDFSWPGAGRFGAATFGGGRKEIGRNFQTFAAGIYNRDYLEDTGYTTFKGFTAAGLTFVPFTARLTRTRTVTPSVVQSQSDLLSVLDEGRVTTYTGSGETTLNLGNLLPRFGGQYTRTITDSQQIQRLEDRETLTGTADYTLPLRFPLLPVSIAGNYSVTNSMFKVYPSTRILDTDAFLDLKAAGEYLKINDYHTLEITESWGLKAPFKPLNSINFAPSYNLKTVREKNRDFAVERQYPKSLTQDVGATAGLAIFPWLQPNANYSISVRENYNLTMSTDSANPIFPSQTKYIERNSQGELSWNLQVRDLVSNRYVQSLGFTSSYRIQDTDSYDNVQASFNPLGAAADRLFIRGNPLLPLTPATSTYLVKSIVEKDDVRVSGKYNPFEAFEIPGRLAPLRTMTANFTYTGNDEHSYITGTRRDVFTRVWPDLTIGLAQWERFFSIEPWISDTQFNFRHQKKTIDTSGISSSKNVTYGGEWRFNFRRRIDMNFTVNTTDSEEFDAIQNLITSRGKILGWSGQGGFSLNAWRFILRYESSQDSRTDSVGKLSAQMLTTTYTGQVNADMSFPKGLPIPFSRRTLPLTNRFIFNGNIKYITHRSALNIERDNNNNYGLTANAEYEVSSNFRLMFGLGWNRFEYPDNSQANYTALELTSRLTIQF